MPENTFNTPAGQTIARELMIAYLNTGTKEAPVWSPFGKRTSDSSIDYDWGEDTSKDILGNTWTTMKKPTMTQGFDPWDLDGGDAAQQKIYQLAVVEQNAQAALSVADRGYVLETGRISLSGTGAELMASDQVRKAYLGG